jgi:hypothetical protein
MAKDASGEIDTIFEAEEGKAVAIAAEQLKSRSAEISLSAEQESTKAEITETAAVPEKTFIFSGIPRQVYCTLSDKTAPDSNRRGSRDSVPDFHANLRKQAQRRSQGSGLDFRCRSVHGKRRVHSKHLSRNMGAPLRSTAGRVESGLQLGAGLDQSRGQRTKGEPQMAVLAARPHLRVRSPTVIPQGRSHRRSAS